MPTPNPISSVKAALEHETHARDEVRRQLSIARGHMSQRALAAQLGISQPAIAQRLAGYESDYETRALETLPSLAEHIRHSLAAKGESLSTRLRLVAQGMSDSRSLTRPHDQRFFLREPSSTGDPRWDAFLAGGGHDPGAQPATWMHGPPSAGEAPAGPTDLDSFVLRAKLAPLLTGAPSYAGAVDLADLCRGMFTFASMRPPSPRPQAAPRSRELGPCAAFFSCHAAMRAAPVWDMSAV